MSEELVDKFPDANALLCNVIPDIVYSALKKIADFIKNDGGKCFYKSNGVD